MFKSISIYVFIKCFAAALIIYYGIVLWRYFRKDIRSLWQRIRKKQKEPPDPGGGMQEAVLVIFILLFSQWASAQTADGNNGINQANTLVRGYFDTGVNLMYAIGAILGLVGAIRVFKLWTTGHREDVGAAAAGWFGSCVFLVIVATVIKSFFGLT